MEEEDYQNLEEYAKTCSNLYYVPYEEICAEVMGTKQKEQLRRMIGFRFRRHSVMNLLEEHPEAAERLLEKECENFWIFQLPEGKAGQDSMRLQKLKNPLYWM